jgi:hypothetical protein
LQFEDEDDQKDDEKRKEQRDIDKRQEAERIEKAAQDRLIARQKILKQPAQVKKHNDKALQATRNRAMVLFGELHGSPGVGDLQHRQRVIDKFITPNPSKEQLDKMILDLKQQLSKKKQELSGTPGPTQSPPPNLPKAAPPPRSLPIHSQNFPPPPEFPKKDKGKAPLEPWKTIPKPPLRMLKSYPSQSSQIDSQATQPYISKNQPPSQSSQIDSQATQPYISKNQPPAQSSNLASQATQPQLLKRKERVLPKEFFKPAKKAKKEKPLLFKRTFKTEPTKKKIPLQSTKPKSKAFTSPNVKANQMASYDEFDSWNDDQLANTAKQHGKKFFF